MNYLVRKKCVITGTELERLSECDYPLHCGCTDEELSKDVIAKECFAISKAGILQLEKLIPLEILYEKGHEAGAVGTLWQEHHLEFAKFILEFKPQNILEIGGGHSKLGENILKKAKTNYTIIEPNPTNLNGEINYIKGFFSKELCKDYKFDCVVHSHTFEHIYNPSEFLDEIAQTLTGGGDYGFFAPKYAKMA